ncbi:hypothetical protein TH61_08945 [Rufibacter sp. DG15C]|uniref:T9SS type A sorting domain-containing protein n=1 Tax=Rufibacter sp. DG15C TaxID=1379909 RepID=UPI00078D684B|nr:T9SS type A sorting domain-containing protein [Rufibacter sp. DG15C]AMM51273.1 hypothetical protein TH61_08945 [Rufibacter sp. DG15C]
MKHPVLLALIVLFLLPLTMHGEGSKQLTPNLSTAALTDPNNDKAGYLAHDANFPSASGVSITSLSFLKPSGFSRNGATFSSDHRLLIRVKSGERLFYGVRRAIHDQAGTANQDDLIITIRRAASSTDQVGVIVQRTTLTNNTNSTNDMLLNAQNGVIGTAAQVNVGPKHTTNGRAYNTTGYDPLGFLNDTGADQDYWVEFEQVGEANMADGQRFSVYDLWDFTVIDAAGAEKPGRMRSKLWSFSAGGTTNVFSKNFNMFPLIPSEDQANAYFVKKVELAGIAPQNFFRFVTNKYGSTTAAGSSNADRRKSQLTQTDYPELFNFVNNPDVSIWPSATAPTFTVGVASVCNTATNGGKSIFSLNTTESSTFIVLINLNGVAGYQPGSSDVLLESTGSKGARTVEWNGLNGLGQAVAKGTSLDYFFRNNSAPIHFPVWDAEANVGGFRVEDVRPVAGSNYNGLLFWDDSNLPTTTFPSPQTELYGVVSTTGAHAWGSASTTAGDLKTVNTWTYGYTGSSTQTAAFNYDCSADVAVTNVASAGTYIMGQPFTYTVTVTNNGPIPATNIQVTDKLDASKLTFVSSSDATNYNSGTGIWTVGTLAVGASKTLTITAQPLVTGSIAATATQTHTEADNVTNNNSATATIAVQPAADIEVKNVSDKSTYNNGDLVTYTITARNIGPNAATGVSITDKLPAGLTLEGTIPSAYNASTGVWTVGALAINETKTLTLTARISTLESKTTTASLDNRAGFEIDSNSGNNSASNTITVAPVADVAVTSSVSNTNPGQNEIVTFTVKATNNGPNSATNVVLANAIPAGMEITGSSASLGSFDKNTGTWTVGSIAAGASQTLTVFAKAANTGTYTLQSTQSHTEYDAQASNNTASSSFTAKPTADLGVTNTVSPAAGTTYATNDVVTFTVGVKNNGPSTATNVVVTDKLPASLTFISSTSTSYDATTGLWTVGTLASGASTTFQITARINQSAVITTTATQTHTEQDIVLGNNSASTSIQSGSGVITADIAVATSAPKTEYYTGDVVPFRVLVTNTGPDAATNITIGAALPAGMTLTGSDPRVGTYANGVWNIPSLAAGASTQLFLTGTPTVDTGVTGDKTYNFTATRTGTAEQVDDNTTNNTSTTPIVVHKSTDVATSITITSNDPTGKFYHNITEATFRIIVTNNGPDVVTGLQGQDTRTGAINFTGLFPPTGTSYDTSTGIWNIGTLQVGESKTLVITGIPNQTGQLNLGGGVSKLGQTDNNPENNTAVALVNILPVAELAVTNTVASATFYNGQESTFTVKVQNNGPDAASGVVIEDKLPAGLTLVSAKPSLGTYDAATGLWTLGSDILPGAANAQTLVLTVKPQSAGSYSTTASVNASSNYDNITANNSATATIQGSASADIMISSNIVSGPYYVGGKYVVNVTATNLGPNTATNVIIGAELATGLTLVAGSGVPSEGTSINPATQAWTIPSLPVNGTATLTLQVEPTTIGILNNTVYKAYSAEYDPSGGNTKDGNNSSVVYLSVTDREATAQVLLDNKHMFNLKTGDRVALVTDPDGAITNATIASGSLPAGMRLTNNGELEVDYRFNVVPGTYLFDVATTDAFGGMSTTSITYSISGDWDKDGVLDVNDLDDNNDGVLADPIDAGYNPMDIVNGTYRFLDKTFVHATYGAFRDVNNDDINDVFDWDLDGLIRGYDIDKDGDGIPNAVEANGGKIPAASTGYNPELGYFTGPVSANGMPIAAQTSNNSGVSNLANPDSDGDGFSDQTDVDSDNDGILDNIEAQTTLGFANGLGTDSDFDGLSDGFDKTTGGTMITPTDTDKDGTPDYLDLDSDNDDLSDNIEAFDEDLDGLALEEMKNRGRLFEASTGKGYYVVGADDSAPWLNMQNNKPLYLIKESIYYHDTDFDGLVDLFDTDNSGRSATLQTYNEGEYAYRTNSPINPLPVTLVSFEGHVVTKGVQLNWSTATEKNNAKFVVERSSNGKTFQATGEVKGAGNSSLLLNYSFLDATSPVGTVYYRLKQVDLDGSSENSKVIAVKIKTEATSTTKLNAYPNPTTSVVNLDLSSLSNTKVTIMVYSLDGRLVQTSQVQGGGTQKVDLSNLAVGTYLLKISTPEVTVIERVVKQ